MKPDRITYRCQQCASESVDKQVPYEWNAESQSWEPNFLKMDFVCRSCGHDGPAAELHHFRGAQLLLTGAAIARLEEAAMFYMDHAELPAHELETLRTVLKQLEAAPIDDLEIDAKTGHEWAGPSKESDSKTATKREQRNVHPLWRSPNARRV